jgi:hypothetical protein
MALGCGLTLVRATEEKITKMNRWFTKKQIKKKRKKVNEMPSIYV